jgi:mechanosensitive ion channel-like protein
MEQFRTIGSTALNSLSAFFSFLPTLLGAIVILTLGWFIAGLLAKLIEKALVAVGFERAVHHSGIGHFIEGSAVKLTTSRLVAQLAKWFVFLLFVQAAANLLQMPQITALMNSIVLFIPQVIVAVAIVVLGSLGAKVLSGMVERTGSPRLLATLTSYAVIGFAVIAAIDQLGIATAVVNTLFIGLVGSLALATGLAFGLGGREIAGKIAQSWYEGAQTIAQQAKTAQPTEVNGSPRVFTSARPFQR